MDTLSSAEDLFCPDCAGHVALESDPQQPGTFVCAGCQGRLVTREAAAPVLSSLGTSFGELHMMPPAVGRSVFCPWCRADARGVVLRGSTLDCCDQCGSVWLGRAPAPAARPVEVAAAPGPEPAPWGTPAPPSPAASSWLAPPVPGAPSIPAWPSSAPAAPEPQAGLAWGAPAPSPYQAPPPPDLRPTTSPPPSRAAWTSGPPGADSDAQALSTPRRVATTAPPRVQGVVLARPGLEVRGPTSAGVVWGLILALVAGLGGLGYWLFLVPGRREAPAVEGQQELAERYRSYFSTYTFGGRTPEWWTRRLNDLRPGGPAESPRLYDLTVQRAKSLGLTVEPEPGGTVVVRPSAELSARLLKRLEIK